MTKALTKCLFGCLPVLVGVQVTFYLLFEKKVNSFPYLIVFNHCPLVLLYSTDVVVAHYNVRINMYLYACVEKNDWCILVFFSHFVAITRRNLICTKTCEQTILES